MAPSGLMRFDIGGRALWSQGVATTDFAMVDCYALNVGRRQVWSCCYTDFPILSIDLSGTHRLRPNAIEGAKAIAIDRHFGLLAGGYAQESHRLVLFRCDKHEIKTLAAYDLDLGFSRERPAQLFTARQDTLHIVLDDQWYRSSVMDVALVAGVFY
ncbi:hypothetical protein AB4037_00235 [Labrys sp. KB_33_2]|uniref:hypothetical protein n=1 Tax=Labrys sp. KB_33_2 TaxID=3237479 RepID=UPI003F93A201